MKKSTIAAAAAFSLLAGAASADIIEYNFYVGGDQEVPPNDSDATGAGQLLYDTDTQTFSIDLVIFGIELDDLLGVGPNSSPIHIHNAPAGSNGPIVIDLGFLDDFEDFGLGIRYSVSDQLFGGTYGDITSDPNDNQAALFAGELYVNVHTVDYASGEVRGQLVPAPGAAALLGLGGLVACRRRRA